MPAITAKFTADVTDFRAKLSSAQTSVTAFQRTTTQVNNELKKFGNEFSGATLIRQAETMARAVEEIGGVTRLTEKEQKRLNDTVQDALAKYKALGQEAPVEMRLLATELKHVQKEQEKVATGAGKTKESIGGVSGLLSKVGPAVAGAFSVGAVVGFAKQIIDLGGEIEDLSSRTGLGVETVQEFKFAAEQTGSSIDAFAGAVDKMSNKIAEGSHETRVAVKDLGLSFEDIKNMSPEDAFTAIAEAIKDVPDPMRQTQLAMDLFGDAGTRTLPAIRQGFSDLRQQARETGQVLSEENVRALAEFGDKWDATMMRIKASSATAVLDVGRGFASMFDGIRQGLDNLVPSGLVSFLNNPTLQWLMQMGGQSALQSLNALPGLGLVDTVLEAGRRGQKEQAERTLDRLGNETLRTRSNRVAPSGPNENLDARYLKDLADKGRAAFAAATRENELYGTSLTKLADKLGVAETSLKRFQDEQKRSIETAKRMKEASLSGQLEKDIEKAKLYAKELESGRVSIANLGSRQVEVNKTLRDAEQAMRALGMTGDPLFATITKLANATQNWGQSLGPVKRGIDDLVKDIPKASEGGLLNDLLFGTAGHDVSKVRPGIDSMPGLRVDNADKQFRDSIKDAKAETIAWQNALIDVGDQFMRLGQQGSGAFAMIMEASGLALAGLTDWKKTQDARREKDDPTSGFGMIGNMWQDADTTGKKLAAGVTTGLAAVEGGTAIWAATDVAGRGNRAGKGALAGAKVGMQFGGPYGAVIGAGVGALVGALRNPGFEQEMKRISKEFGVDVSEELARAIDKQKKQFGGDRAAAEIFNFDKIVGEAGGLKIDNFERLAGKFRDTFSMLETGKFSTQQTRDMLEKNFGVFAQFVEKSNTLIGNSFTDVLALAKREGLVSDEMKAFVAGQTGRSGNALQAMMGPLAELVEARKEMKRLDEESSKIRFGGEDFNDLGIEDRKTLDELDKAWDEQRDKANRLGGAAGDVAAQMERFGVIALGAFNGAKKSGLDTLSAVMQLSPALDQYIELQKELGIEATNAQVADMTHYRDLVMQHQTLVVAAGATKEALLAANNTGGLTQEVLKAVTEQAVVYHEQLMAAGFTQEQALEMQADGLKLVMEGHKKLGIPLDENTKKLIEQANKLGLLKEKDPSKLMEQNFDKLTGTVGLLAKTLGADVPDAIQTLIDKLSEIPSEIDTTYNFHYNDPGRPDLPPGAPETPELPGAANGIWATGPTATWFGEGGQPELGGPVDFMGDVLGRAMAKNRAWLDDMLGARLTPPPLPVSLGGAPVSGGPLSLRSTIVMPNGAVLAEVVSKAQPDVLAAYGVRRRH